VTSQTVQSDTQNADVIKTICWFEVKLTENVSLSQLHC